MKDMEALDGANCKDDIPGIEDTRIIEAHRFCDDDARCFVSGNCEMFGDDACLNGAAVSKYGCSKRVAWVKRGFRMTS